MDECDCARECPKRAQFERWREQYRGSDDETRAASKPIDIANAELVLGLMERFNYKNIAAVLEEDAEILQLLEAESYGYKRDEQERMDELEAETEAMKAKAHT